MTPLKCLHLNSVTRSILITILVSIFSQSFDCKPTTPLLIQTREQGNINHTIDNGNYTSTESNLNTSSRCDVLICADMVPPKFPDAPAIKKDEKPSERKRSAPKTDDDANDGKSYGNDRPVLPAYLLNTLQEYKIMMDPSVERVNDQDYRVTLHVNVIRKRDNQSEMALPSIQLPCNVLKDPNSTDFNSSILPIAERVNADFERSLSSSTINNQDRSADPAINYANVVTTPTNIDLNPNEDPTPPTNIDLSNKPDQNNQTSDPVSSSSLSTSVNYESRSRIDDNNFIATSPTTSTTMEPLISTESNPGLTPFPSNEVETRQEKPSTIQPEITTTSKFMIATPNPIDLISASTLVGSSKTSHTSSNVFTLSTEVSKAVESRIVSSTLSPLQTSGSSSIQPKMSEIELNHAKGLYDKKVNKPIKSIPETPWIPAYEVKPIGFNKQDSDNHIEYRFAQHDDEFNVRRNIPQPRLQPKPQPQPKSRLASQSRYGPGMDMRTNNDRQQKVVKSDHPNPYVPRNPGLSLKDRQANVPNNRNEPYAVEEIVHFERPVQRLNTRQYKPTPELFVRIIRHYFDNALSPAETIYTAKHKSPVIAPGQPLYQRSPPSLSYRNSKP